MKTTRKTSAAAVKKPQKKDRTPKGMTSDLSKRLQPFEREVVKNVVAELYTKGASYHEMSVYLREEKKISITGVALVKYVKDVLEDWHAKRITDIQKKISGELMKLQEVERQAWLGWEASRGLKTKRYTSKRGVPRVRENGQITVDTVGINDSEETFESEGNPKFLEIIMQCINRRLELLGTGGGEVPLNPELINEKPQTIVFNTYIPPELAEKYKGFEPVKTINVNPVS